MDLFQIQEGDFTRKTEALQRAIYDDVPAGYYFLELQTFCGIRYFDNVSSAKAATMKVQSVCAEMGYIVLELKTLPARVQALLNAGPDAAPMKTLAYYIKRSTRLDVIAPYSTPKNDLWSPEILVRALEPSQVATYAQKIRSGKGGISDRSAAEYRGAA